MCLLLIMHALGCILVVASIRQLIYCLVRLVIILMISHQDITQLEYLNIVTCFCNIISNVKPLLMKEVDAKYGNELFCIARMDIGSDGL